MYIILSKQKSYFIYFFIDIMELILYNIDVKGVVNMWIFLLILSILVLSIILIIVGSIIEISIFICTKEKIEFIQTLLPGFLSVISFSIIFYFTSTLLSIFNINIVQLLYMFLLKIDFNFSALVYATFTYLIAFILFTIVQAFYIKLVYIDYANIFKKSKPKKLSRSENIDHTIVISYENSLCEIKTNNISFLNSYSVSILSSTIIFFIFILFIFLGTVIGDRLL